MNLGYRINSAVALLACLLSFSCQNSQIEGESVDYEDNFEIIVLDAMNSSLFPDQVSALYNIIDIAPLETSEEVLIARCDKIILHNNKYYVLDRKFNSLSVFSQSGKFLEQVGKLGRGPGEFQAVNDFNFDLVNERIVIYSLEDMRLFFFNFDGDFLESRVLDFYADTFEILDANQLVFYINYNPSYESSRNNVVVTDYSGKVKRKLMPFGPKAQAAISFSGFFKSYNNEYLFNNAFSDTLYVLNSSLKTTEALIFDFNGYKWKHGFDFSKLYNESIERMAFLGNATFISKDWIFSKIMYKQRLRNVLRNRENDRVYNEFNQKSDLLFKLIKTPHLQVSENTYVSSLTASSYQSLIKSYPDEWESFQDSYPDLVKALEVIHSNDNNPVLITYELKENEK